MGLNHTVTTAGNDSLKNSTKSPASQHINVRRMSTDFYDKIVESDGESNSSRNDTDMSGTSSERAHKFEMRQSNVFLLKVIQGRVPNEMLNSRITSTDRENLSTLIP